ncbi:IQ domain-containing protein N [Monodelphis domestica]|uniref:IQ domain-containing protein N n=1 Tax=Monodelphis domestica TaxID=13616 RepID=UPI0024E20B44|nr:IQ domain-containing protein N [Monodelphis domestica]
MYNMWARLTSHFTKNIKEPKQNKTQGLTCSRGSSPPNPSLVSQKVQTVQVQLLNENTYNQIPTHYLQAHVLGYNSSDRPFHNVLVDEMDMMLTKAATVIQSAWRGHHIRQKLGLESMVSNDVEVNHGVCPGFSVHQDPQSSQALGHMAKNLEQFQALKENSQLQDIPYSETKPKTNKDHAQLWRPMAHLHQSKLEICSPEFYPPQSKTDRWTQVSFQEEDIPAIEKPSQSFLEAKEYWLQSQNQPEAKYGALKSHRYFSDGESQVPPETYPMSSQMDPPLEEAKALFQEQPTVGSAKTLVITGITKVPFQANLIDRVGKNSSQTQFSAKAAPPLAYPVATMTKVSTKEHQVARGTKVPPQALPTAGLTKVSAKEHTVSKAPPQARPTVGSTKVSPKEYLASVATKVLTQEHDVYRTTKNLSQLHLTDGGTKAPPQALPKAGTVKISSKGYTLAGGTKGSPQFRLVIGGTKAPPRPSAPCKESKLSYQGHSTVRETKTPSLASPIIKISKFSFQKHCSARMTKASCQAHLEVKATQVPSHEYLEVKATQVPSQSDLKNEVIQGPFQPYPETRVPSQVPLRTTGTEVPLQAHTRPYLSKYVSWRDMDLTRYQALQEQGGMVEAPEMAKEENRVGGSQVEKKTNSQQQLGSVLSKALSQGEVRTAVTNALSQEMLGPSMVKTFPQGMLGPVLIKALSHGALGTSLTRALSRGELRAEVAKAMSQGKLREALDKVLTKEERAALNQALTQGELRTVLSQVLSQGVLAAMAKSFDIGAASSTPLKEVGAATQVDVGEAKNTILSGNPSPSRVVTPREHPWQKNSQETSLPAETGDSNVNLNHSEGPVAGREAPSLAPGNRDSGVPLGLPWGNPIRGVASSLHQNSEANAGATANLHQLFMSSGLSSILPWGSMASGMVPNLPQESVATELVRSLLQDPLGSEVVSTVDEPSMASGGIPNLLQEPGANEITPGLHQSSVASEMTMSLQQPSVARGMAHSQYPASEASRARPRLFQDSGVSEIDPNLCQGSIASEMVSELPEANGLVGSISQRSRENRVGPSLNQALIASGVTPNSSNVSVSTGMPSNLCHRPGTTAISPNMYQMSGVSQESLIGGLTPRQHQTSVAYGVTPTLQQQGSVASELAPGLYAASVNSRASPSLHQASKIRDVAPNPYQVCGTNMVDQSPSRTAMEIGILSSQQNLTSDRSARSLSQSSMTTKGHSKLANESVLSFSPAAIPRVQAPDFHQVSQVTSSILHHALRPSAESLQAHLEAHASDNANPSEQLGSSIDTKNLQQGSMSPGFGVEPSLHQVSMTSGVVQSLPETSMPCGVGSGLSETSVARKVGPCLNQAPTASRMESNRHLVSTTSELTPSLSRRPLASGLISSRQQVFKDKLEPYIYQQSMIRGNHGSGVGAVTPSPNQHSLTNEIAPNLPHAAQKFMSYKVGPNLSQEVVPSSHRRPVGREGVIHSQVVGAGEITPKVQWRPEDNEVISNVHWGSEISEQAPNEHRGTIDTEEAPNIYLGSIFNEEVPSVHCVSTVSKVAPRVQHHSMVNEIEPNIQQGSLVIGVLPSVARGSEVNRMVPDVIQEFGVTGATPSGSYNSLVSEVAPGKFWGYGNSGEVSSVAQASVVDEAIPNTHQGYVIGKVSLAVCQRLRDKPLTPAMRWRLAVSQVVPHLFRECVPSGEDPRMNQGFVPSGVTLSMKQGSLTDGVTPNVNQRPVSKPESQGTHRKLTDSKFYKAMPNREDSSVIQGTEATTIVPHVNQDVASNIHQPVPRVVQTVQQRSISKRTTQNINKKPVASGVTPNVHQRPVVSGVTPSAYQGSKVGVPIRVHQESRIRGTPNVPQESKANAVTQNVSWDLEPIGTTPSIHEKSMSSGVAPKSNLTSRISKVTPNVNQGSMLSGVSPSVYQRTTPSGPVQILNWGSMTSEEAPSVSLAPETSKITPCAGQESVASEMTSSGQQESMPREEAPCVNRGSGVKKIAPNVHQKSMASKLIPNAHRGFQKTGVAPTKTGWRSRTRDIAPSTHQASAGNGVAPVKPHEPKASRTVPSVTQGHIASKGTPRKHQGSRATSMVQSINRGSVASGVARVPQNQESVASGVTPSIYQRSPENRVLQGSLTSGMPPNVTLIRDRRVISEVNPRATSQRAASPVAPSIQQTSRALPIVNQESGARKAIPNGLWGLMTQKILNPYTKQQRSDNSQSSMNLNPNEGIPNSPQDSRNVLAEIREAQHRAAAEIQAAFRGHLERKVLKIQNEAATRIQAGWRGLQNRKALAHLTEAATKIQATWRSHHTRQRLMSGAFPWTEQLSSDQQIPPHHCFRSCQPGSCVLCRKLQGREENVPICLALLTQSSFRTCHICQRTFETRMLHGLGQGDDSLPNLKTDHPLTRQEAVLLIQALWRGHKVRQDLEKQQMAATRLQAAWRGHHTRSNLIEETMILGPTLA